ncbi:MAG: hypothetical protein U0746_06815 [Gemmataceae bacterium]
MTPLSCKLLAHGVVRATAAEITALRREPAPGVIVPATLLKFADDQAVVGVSAVIRAVQSSGRPNSDFVDWGVVGAPRYFGRLAAAAVIKRHDARGAPGVSPLVAPQMSLHSVAGGVSLALGCHGPVTGLGGGVDSLSDGLIGGLSLLDSTTPGVWIVLTAYDPEPMSECDPAAICHAVALALTPDAGGVRLDRGNGDERLMSVASLGRFLENDRAPEWECALVGGWRFSLVRAAAEVAKAA